MSKLERNIAVVFGLAVALLLGLGALIAHNARQTAATFRELDRANRVLRAAETVLLDLLNIQTATRGFLLTGDEAFLAPYLAGATDIPRALAELEAACAEHPHHTARVAEIVAANDALSDLIEERLRARRADDFSPDLMLDNLRAGKKLMGTVRTQIEAIETDERAVLQRHSLAMQHSATNTAHLLWILGVSAVVVVTFAGGRVLSETRARAHAETALRELNRDLEQRVEARTRELALSTARLQTLSRRLLEIQETERRALAQELHDEIGQAITAVKISLQALQRSPPPPATLPARLQSAVELAAGCLDQTRSLSLNLRPPMLDDLGLASAVHWLVSRQSREPSAPRVAFDNGIDERRPKAAVEVASFRIIQEALTNAARHAGARHIKVSLHQESDRLECAVEDDGAGFDYAATRERALQQGTSLGLAGMEERAMLAGGSLRLTTAPGRGTRVVAQFSHAFPS